MLKNLLLVLMILMGTLSAAPKRIYIDGDDFSVNEIGNSFYIHQGENRYLETHSIHKDSKGLFTYETSLVQYRDGHKAEYEQKWKCPYCHNFFPRGQACSNADCPSKYK